MEETKIFPSESGSCQTEKVLNSSLLGAAAFSMLEENDKIVDKRERDKFEKKRDEKLLQSKSLFYNASMSKDSVEIPEDNSFEDEKNRLHQIIQLSERLDNALRMKSVSKTIYELYHGDDDEKRKLISEALLKLSTKDAELHRLTKLEADAVRELEAAKVRWRTAAEEWTERKKQNKESAERRSNAAALDDAENASQISKMIFKMEVMKAIQGRLIASFPSYDWVNDPHNLERYLESARRAPYTLKDFL